MSIVANARAPKIGRKPDASREAFDLRPHRDVCTRRVWRERMRRVIRVCALLTGEMAGSSLALALALSVDVGLGWTELSGRVLELFPLFVVLVIGSQAAMGTYGPNRARQNYLKTCLGGIVTVAAFALLGRVYSQFRVSSDAYLLLVTGTSAVCVGTRLLVEHLIRAIYRRDMGRHPTLIIGEHEAASEILVHLIVSRERRVKVIGHLVPDPAKDPTALGGLDLLGELIEQHDIRSVIVSAQLNQIQFKWVLRECLLHGTAVSVVPGTLSEFPCKVSSQEIMGWPLIELSVPRLHLLQIILKRTVDLIGATLGLLFLSPVAAVLAIAIKRDSPGSVLFRQQRLGLGGRPFTIYKFRSMRADAEQRLRADSVLFARYLANDYKLPPAEDPRVTRLGQFLRRSSLDELPQLVNVLRGDMSLVGPRPIVPDEIRNYGSDSHIFLAVKPGLTGNWQANGRSAVVYPERADLDIGYITNWTLANDFRILWQTIPALIRKRGAH